MKKIAVNDPVINGALGKGKVIGIEEGRMMPYLVRFASGLERRMRESELQVVVEGNLSDRPKWSDVGDVMPVRAKERENDKFLAMSPKEQLRHLASKHMSVANMRQALTILIEMALDGESKKEL